MAFKPGTDRVRLSKSGREQAQIYEAFMLSYIKHTDNKYFGKPFVMDDWQRDLIWYPMFGQGRYVGKGDDRWFKRSKSVVVEGVPRSGGKSDFACAALLTVATMEPVNNGEYAVIAYSKDQAQKDFQKLKTMIRLDPELSEMWKPQHDVIVNRETGARIMVFPYSESALQSWHLNMAVLDEVHTYRDDTLYEAVISGQRDIPNALTLIITTAAGSRSGFLWNQLPKWREDPNAHVCWIGAADDDDLDDERMWKRTHPMSWVPLEKVRTQRVKLGSKSFERYEVNRFPLEKSADRSMKQADIKACVSKGDGFDFSRPFALGVDGATRGDSFAIVAHQIGEDGTDRWHEWVYDDPGERGYYDLNQIESLIAGLHQKHGCPVGIDPARLLLMAQQLQDDYGVEIYEVPQSNKIMCPACSLVVNSVKSRSSMLGGTPKLAEHLGNCRDLIREPYGTRFTSDKHGQGTERIDAAIAGAIAKWMTQTMPEELSFAETGGVWTVTLGAES